jgi:murein DD-endopeptidase MepM/ murein hydrolase activator NlpD
LSGGNCIKIKHNSTYETIYAHMKNFARGIKEGIRVKQGQIICV